MRIDKYLKVSKLIKRRAVAKELLSRQLFTVNGKIVKPSYEIKIGDVITLRLGQKMIEVEVMNIFPFTKGAQNKEMYKILKEKKIDVETQDK
jgi:ribosomal 50S subunit-recycling heat shock protein